MLIILTSLQGGGGAKVRKENKQSTSRKCTSAAEIRTKDETAPLILLTPKIAEVLGTCRRAQKVRTQRKRRARMVVGDGDAAQTGAHIRGHPNLPNTQPGGGGVSFAFVFDDKYTPV